MRSERRSSSPSNGIVLPIIVFTSLLVIFLYFDTRTDMSYAAVLERSTNATVALAEEAQQQQQQPQPATTMEDNYEENNSSRRQRYSISWKLLWIYFMLPSLFAAVESSRRREQTGRGGAPQQQQQQLV